MPDFLVQVDKAQVAEVQRLLAGVKNGVPKVLTRAINKVAAWAQSRVIHQVSDAAGLALKDVRKAVRLRRASYRLLRAAIRIYNRRMPLVWFHARQTKKGVTFRAPPGADWALDYKGGRKGRFLVERAFIARMTRGHVGVFLRRGKKRLPIDELFGPSPMAVFAGVTGMIQALMAEAQGRLVTETDRQVEVLIKQEAAAGGALETRSTSTALEPRAAA